MSQVATSTDQPTTGLPLLAKEPRRALQSQKRAQIPSLPILCPTMAAGSWKVPGSLSVFKTPQQQPLARGQLQTRSELLSRVRARVSLPKGISLWQFPVALICTSNKASG